MDDAVPPIDCPRVTARLHARYKSGRRAPARPYEMPNGNAMTASGIPAPANMDASSNKHGNALMNPLVTRLYWQFSALLLACHLVGWHHGLPLVIALNVVQALHVGWVRRGWRALDAQVRLAFLGLLIVGLIPPAGIVHAAQLIGVTAILVADYCLLARLLSLLPWNRQEPLGWALVRRALFTPPAPGAVVLRSPERSVQRAR
jgi:hypothetical protein